MTPHAALSQILENIPACEIEPITLSQAPGRVLQESIYADRPFPAFDRVMMDGIAIASTALERDFAEFDVSGLAKAGNPAIQLSLDTACIRVNTGAVLPIGCDQVIPVEQLQFEGDSKVKLVEKVEAAPFQFVHRAGSDFETKSSLLEPGCIIGAKETGVLASVGAATMKVSKLPKVVLISTGDELVDIDEQPLPHQIRRSNIWALHAACASLHIPVECMHIPDEAHKIETELERLMNNECWLILSGGISKGTHDFIPQALEKLGAKQHFQWVKQRPGKPMAFYTARNGAPIFALPGNPMSTLCCLHRYVIPALESHLGLRSRARLALPLAEPFNFGKPLALFLPVKRTLDSAGNEAVIPVPTQNSGDFASIMDTDGFIELPASQDTFPVGGRFPFYPWI